MERGRAVNGNRLGEEDPAAALALVRETQRAAAVRARAPAWYHPAVGGVLAVVVAAIESDRLNLLSALALCVLAVVVSQYQKQTGTRMNAFFAGGRRPRRILGLGTAAIVTAIGLGLWLKFGLGLNGAMIVTGAVVGLFATWLGFAWERAFLAEPGT
jgi:hypothetical protein